MGAGGEPEAASRVARGREGIVATATKRRSRRRRMLAVVGALLLMVAWRLPALLRAVGPCDESGEDGVDVPCGGVLAPGTDAVLVPGFRIEVEPMDPLELDADLFDTAR